MGRVRQSLRCQDLIDLGRPRYVSAGNLFRNRTYIFGCLRRSVGLEEV
jgi:hypothetical protein